MNSSLPIHRIYTCLTPFLVRSLNVINGQGFLGFRVRLRILSYKKFAAGSHELSSTGKPFHLMNTSPSRRPTIFSTT